MVVAVEFDGAAEAGAAGAVSVTVSASAAGLSVGVVVVPGLVNLPSSLLLPPPAAVDALALVLLLTVEDWAAAAAAPEDDALEHSLVGRSLDGVEARESLSLSPLPFFPVAFLFLPVALACSLCTSFWRCTFASLYLRTRFSGTHSSQLQRIAREWGLQMYHYITSYFLFQPA